MFALVLSCALFTSSCKEAEFWMDMLVACDLVPKHKIEALMRETSELTAIITASCITKRRNMKKSGGLQSA